MESVTYCWPIKVPYISQNPMCLHCPFTSGHVYLIDRKCRVWNCPVAFSAFKRFTQFAQLVCSKVQLPLPNDHARCQIFAQFLSLLKLLLAYMATSIVCRAPGWHHKTLLDGELVVDSEDAEVLQANCLESCFGCFKSHWPQLEVTCAFCPCNPGIQSGKADMSPILGV